MKVSRSREAILCPAVSHENDGGAAARQKGPSPSLSPLRGTPRCILLIVIASSDQKHFPACLFPCPVLLSARAQR